MKATFILREPIQAHKVIADLWALVKPWVVAGHRLCIQIKPATRTIEQNAKFHAMCGDFEKSGLHWMGKPRTAKQWKVLLVSGHAIATKEETEVIPGLEGEFINIRESTALMSIARSSSLIEYSIAFGAQNGVRFTAPEYA